MPTLRIIAGPNGSGKSTLSASEYFGANTNLIDPDAIARNMNSVDPAQAAIAAGRAAILLAKQFLEQRADFTVETTLAGNGQLKLLQDAQDVGYRIEVLFIALDQAEMNIDRVKQRTSRGGHDVPDDDIRRRYSRSLANAPKALRAADMSVVFDNAGLEPTEILRLKNGAIVWELPGPHPPWIQDLKRALSA
jgi:predicted ABC-type ATPase